MLCIHSKIARIILNVCVHY